MRGITRLVTLVATLALVGTAFGQPPDTLRIMAPAAPGGGWDGTARAMQTALQETGIVDKVEVFNVPGAGGTIGLSQLATAEAGQEDLLMVMGLVMVGAILSNDAPVTLANSTPIARLTAEYEVIVVPANSPHQTLQDLIDAFRADPGSVSWGGGSAGGTDHILVGLIANEVGVDPTLVNYVAFSGGGEALASIMGGQVTAGVSGYSEWAGQIESGDLRVLAVSSPEALPNVDAPTLRDSGVDLELANWRGVVAPPDLSDEARDRLVDAVDQLAQSEAWQAQLDQFGWTSAYMSGDEFVAYLAEEDERVTEVLRAIGLVD